MRVAIAAAAEPLAIDGPGARPFRAGMICNALVAAGHEVTWWTSNFNHVDKAYRVASTSTVHLNHDGYSMQLLNGRPYGRNISLRRLMHNRDVAEQFEQSLAHLDHPVDLILCCVPTHELATVAIRAGIDRHIPVVLDIRDPWPDIYLAVLPKPLRRVAKLLLRHEYAVARRNLQQAFALTAVSATYLQWALQLAKRERTEFDRVFPIGYPNAPVPQEEKAQTEPFICTFAGTFGGSYDLETVISAARLLEGAPGPPITVRVVGDGDRRAHLQSLAAGLRTVEFTGWLVADELESVLSKSAVGLCPYRRNAVQTLPNKPYEYWTAGLPIANSLSGELATLVDQERVGINYEPGDARSLAASLVGLRNDRVGLRAMSLRASALMVEKFSAERIYTELVQFLEDVRREFPQS